MTATRMTRALAYGWVVLLSLGVVGPALLPGFVLSYDLVFTPRQDLLPGSLGLGGGLPRAVPQDAVVALVETLVPGMLVEKAVLLAIPVLAGVGMLRLLRGAAAGLVGATLIIANPFVAQRLVIGHWGILLAYALVPWALVVAQRLRSSADPWDGLRLVLLCAAGSLTPSGSLLVAVVAVPPALLPRSRLSLRPRLLLAAAVVATWLPWLLPALLHPAGGTADPEGARVFALRADVPGGLLISAVTGGGIWNADVVPPSRATLLTWVLAVFVLALSVYGVPALVRLLGRSVVVWWGTVAVLGVLAALASSLMPSAWTQLLEVAPGGGLARDAQKLLAPWVLLVAGLAGAGAGKLLGHVAERPSRMLALTAIVILPLACQPDLLWGAGGRLKSVAYPGDWAAARSIISEDPRPGDVASFPWTTFRKFPWNAYRTVLDPAPRWLPRTTVVSDDLVIDTGQGLVTVSGDDSRSQAIGRLVAAGSDVAATLPGLGVGWALVAKGTPGPVPDLPGWEIVLDGVDLRLYAAPGGSVKPFEVEARWIAAVDLALASALGAGVAALLIRRVRVRRGGPLVR